MTAKKGRSDRERLEEIVEAIDAIGAHMEQGELNDPLVFDAVRMRLVEIGEAVNDLPIELLSLVPDIPWKEVIAMRHKLTHHYFDTVEGAVAGTVEDDLPILKAAVELLMQEVGD